MLSHSLNSDVKTIYIEEEMSNALSRSAFNNT